MSRLTRIYDLVFEPSNQGITLFYTSRTGLLIARNNANELVMVTHTDDEYRRVEIPQPNLAETVKSLCPDYLQF